MTFPFRFYDPLLVLASGVLAAVCSSCSHPQAEAKTSQPRIATVSTIPVSVREMEDHIVISSELVPFQEIDVYAKEAGYVKELNVDYGSRVRKGQVMAVLEIPELEAQLQQDQAAIKAQSDEAERARHDVARAQAQQNVYRLQYERLAGVAKSQPGLVAQQEVDDAEGRKLAADSQVEAAQGAYEAAESRLTGAKARLIHDQALYDYSKIIAPFDGVVTQRYANFGALMQAGTSTTQSTPLVRLSQEDIYRLVIPVPESCVHYIRVGDPVDVKVPSLNRDFQGKVVRFSADVASDTRTMHTEVDVLNTGNQLIPGLYAEAVLTLNRRPGALAVPIQAIDREGESGSVMILGNGGNVERRTVTLGVQTPNYIEITSGLQAGDKVVVSDRTGLKPGEHVDSHPAADLAYDSSNGNDAARAKP
jgi:RND family efflux transporter MFP subunit